MTDEHPTIASTGKRVYELIESSPAANTAAELTTATNTMNTAQTAYNSAVTAESNALGDGSSGYVQDLNTCAITSIPHEGYLRGASADDIELLTLNDYTYVLKECMAILRDDIWIYEMELAMTTVMKKRAKIYCNLNRDAVLYKDIKNEI